MRRICRNVFLIVLLTGCANGRQPWTSSRVPTSSSAVATSETDVATTKQKTDDAPHDRTSPSTSPSTSTESSSPSDELVSQPLQLTSLSRESDIAGDDDESDSRESTDEAPADAEENSFKNAVTMTGAQDSNDQTIVYEDVVGAVYQSYPLLQSALFSRNVAFGQQIGASGAFDTKLKAASENGPQGFYQTYRQSVGVVQPTYWGGEVFAGYRVGRGDFQPWYQERQTNDGGEFKAGVQVPLARNRDIDARRAELWKAGYGRTLAEPDIQAQLIGYVQEASYGYWDWVAAGENHSIAKRILVLAEDRTNRIEAQVKAGLVDPPELTDNLRLVAIRQAKVSDTRRKMEQTAAKLSVYLRDSVGDPVVPTENQLPGFPEPEPVNDDQLNSDIQLALSRRPELRMLDIVRQQTQVDYTEARNQLQPELNAVLVGSQDVGEPTSSKRDKSPYEGEASLYFDVPMQRRKANGKITELQAKLAQLSAKRRITADKISVDVQMAQAALKSAWEQVEQTRVALGHADDLAARERTNQEAGASDLLKVALREQYAVESAEKNVEALKLYFESQADYRAAMAQDEINR
jgi:outer membrane protein TolC